MKHRSPIEQMVDRACGVPDDYVPPARVTLECSKCRRTKDAVIDLTDPPGTARVVMLCPECAGGDFSLVDYFDKDGKQLLVAEQRGGDTDSPQSKPQERL